MIDLHGLYKNISVLMLVSNFHSSSDANCRNSHPKKNVNYYILSNTRALYEMRTKKVIVEMDNNKD